MFFITYIKLFIYIFAGFFGFLNIAFLILLRRYKRPQNVRLYKTTINFSFSSLLLVITYFLYLFMRVVFGELDNNAILRVFDIIAFLCLKYFWFKIILDIIETSEAKLRKAIDAIFLVFTVLSVINFGFLMDSQYYVENTMIRKYVIAVSILLIIVPLGINFYIIARHYQRLINKLDRIFIISNSILIHLNAFWNGTMAIGLYSGKIFLDTWNTPITDPTSVVLLLINMNLSVFIFQKDFSPLFKPAEDVYMQRDKDHLTDQEIIDILAYKHSLTEREREVVILVYQGFTNPDIAEKLFISKNTARNHIHNIFHKLDVSSRVELVHLVNAQKIVQMDY